ncbi:kinase-like protein [Ascobolus immersus RN42]|uniref:Kinase-like protein n=1 Tax=Ascobolus immersus RN42 TaxID=1160509 RepID=A0A3N4IM81_ASCIM|nr:kinase-like protein [Ascobolus immersus RN42]
MVHLRLPQKGDILRLEPRLPPYNETKHLAVLLGDSFKEGIYTIRHRLGDGVESVVWLAECADDSKPRYVALKIFSAAATEYAINRPVIEALERARDSTSDSERSGIEELVSQGGDHIVRMLDEFVIPGPQGDHVCIVMELVGPQLHPFCMGEREPTVADMSVGMIINSVSQLAKALAFLHRQNIVHGDLQFHNIAFKLPFDAATTDITEILGEPEAILESRYTEDVEDDDCDEDSDDELAVEQQYEMSDLIRYREELLQDTPEVGPWYGPVYYVLAPSHKDWWPHLRSQAVTQVSLMDFSCSFFADPAELTKPEVQIRTPPGFAPPEAWKSSTVPDLFKPLYGTASDMWSFGCIVFTLLTREPLFDIVTIFGAPSWVLFYYGVAQTLGEQDRMPQWFLDMILTLPNSKLFESFLERYDTGDWEIKGTCAYFDGRMDERLEKMKKERIMEGWKEEHLDCLIEVINGTVKWDPKQRLTAEEVLHRLAENDLIGYREALADN